MKRSEGPVGYAPALQEPADQQRPGAFYRRITANERATASQPAPVFSVWATSCSGNLEVERACLCSCCRASSNQRLLIHNETQPLRLNHLPRLRPPRSRASIPLSVQTHTHFIFPQWRRANRRGSRKPSRSPSQTLERLRPYTRTSQQRRLAQPPMPRLANMRPL